MLIAIKEYEQKQNLLVQLFPVTDEYLLLSIVEEVEIVIFFVITFKKAYLSLKTSAR